MRVILLILDGWGYSPEQRGNAILQANLPTLRDIESHYPFFLLKASGMGVGLPWAESGNSEVGHLNIGSGRVVLQSMPRIIKSIQDGSFFRNEVLLGAVEHTKKHNSQLHLMGLLGSGSVHSYIDHLYALLDLAQEAGLSSRVKLHIFTDGKDSPPREGAQMISHLLMRLEAKKQGEIASIVGREYAMDRDYNWDKTKKTFDLLVNGTGKNISDGVKALQAAYENGLTDTEIPPMVWVRDDDAKPRGVISTNDSVIFFNYREDSARQLTKAFILPGKVEFTPSIPENLFFVTMTEYSKDIPSHAAFKPLPIEHTLSEVLADQKKTQLHIAETQKYAHVTYFFNGLKEQKHEGEEWRLISSLDTSDYTKKPELKVPEISQIISQAIEENVYEFILGNFANADLLGHTGNMQATIQGCQSIDSAIKEILGALSRSNDPHWLFIIGSDHGNAEAMIDPVSGGILTEHTSNDVIYYFISPPLRKDFPPLEIMSRKRAAYGILADVAPTILAFFQAPQPGEMTGRSLFSERGIT